MAAASLQSNDYLVPQIFSSCSINDVNYLTLQKWSIGEGSADQVRKVRLRGMNSYAFHK